MQYKVLSPLATSPTQVYQPGSFVNLTDSVMAKQLIELGVVAATEAPTEIIEPPKVEEIPLLPEGVAQPPVILEPEVKPEPKKGK